MGVLAGVTPLAQTGQPVVSPAADDTQGNAVGQHEPVSLFSMNPLPASSPWPRLNLRGELD